MKIQIKKIDLYYLTERIFNEIPDDTDRLFSNERKWEKANNIVKTVTETLDIKLEIIK